MKNLIYKTLFAALAITALSSCLKDDSTVLDPDKGVNVIEFKNTTDIAVHGSTIPLYVHSYEIVPAATQQVTLSYSGPATGAPSDITVNFGPGTQADIDTYNTEQSTSFTLMPAAYYTLTATSVVIPSGQTKASFNIIFKTDQFDLSKSFAIPLKIRSVSSGTISGNFGTIILNVNPKNKYDGRYTVTATAPMTDVTAPTLTGYYPMANMSLITQNANSVAMFDGQYFSTGYFHPIKSGTATSAYGSFSPVFNMDASGKVTSVTNYYGQPASNGRSGQINPAGVNQFTVSADGKTKTLEVSYFMLQPGTSVRTSFYEKWVFTSARP